MTHFLEIRMRMRQLTQSVRSSAVVSGWLRAHTATQNVGPSTARLPSQHPEHLRKGHHCAYSVFVSHCRACPPLSFRNNSSVGELEIRRPEMMRSPLPLADHKIFWQLSFELLEL